MWFVADDRTRQTINTCDPYLLDFVHRGPVERIQYFDVGRNHLDVFTSMLSQVTIVHQCHADFADVSELYRNRYELKLWFYEKGFMAKLGALMSSMNPGPVTTLRKIVLDFFLKVCASFR